MTYSGQFFGTLQRPRRGEYRDQYSKLGASGAIPILRGSSLWMSEMAWVVDIDGVRVVIRATIQSVTETSETTVREFRGQVVNHNPIYPGFLIYGSYDPSFLHPNWLVLEEED